MTHTKNLVSKLVGANPPFPARPVSLAVFNCVKRRLQQNENTKLGLLVAVSGGADSLALCVAAADVALRLNVPLVARVVDHSMRQESKHEALMVAESLNSLNIDAAVLSPPKTETFCSERKGVEEKARDLRYSLLETEAQKWGCACSLDSVDILLGHTMDDQAETVLLRLARGASPSALAAIREVTSTGNVGSEDPTDLREIRVCRVRPILSLRRTDTEAFCDALNLQPVYDPTNKADGPWRTHSNKPLPRNALRERVIPELEQALNQDPMPALARVAQLQAEDTDALNEWANTVFGEAVRMDSGTQIGLDVNVLCAHPKAVRTRVFRLAASQVGIGVPSFNQTGELDRSVWVEKNAKGVLRKVELPAGQAKRKGNLLVFEKNVF